MNRQRSRVVTTLLVIPAFIVVAVTVLAHGCASSNPVAAASDTPQRAYALYGTFVVVEEQAARLMPDPNISASVKNTIRRADARAKPSADALLQALLQYEHVVAQVKAGQTTTDMIAIADQNLATWVTQTTQDIQTLIGAVKGTVTVSAVSSSSHS